MDREARTGSYCVTMPYSDWSQIRHLWSSLGHYLGKAPKITAWHRLKRLFLLVCEPTRPADYQSGGLGNVYYGNEQARIVTPSQKRPLARW